MLEKLKYPIGKVFIPEQITEEHLKEWIETIEEFPEKLETLVQHLTEEQLDTPYREDGWTIRQVIHHSADSHQNSYIHFKWTLTEDTPLIKTYSQDGWAEMFDATTAPVQLSLNVLTALHAKWVYLLKGLSKEDLNKEFIHPESNETISLAKNIGIYSWHCKHHYTHIYYLMERKDWLR